ncbi:MAG: pantoate--beta-alanine ligase [Verrucomicrobiales bacterium]|nr:pantoate--beta-alanine ligase [Verrucomicrobiales bacterium]
MAKTPAAIQRLARIWKQDGVRIGFVPTMGYLHEGHASLIRVARRRVGTAGKVVVSIYVNPTQFAPNEDLSRYPRDLPRDLRMCRAEGVDAVFLPSDAVMYPGRDAGGYSTYVVEERLSLGMEGGSRPTHFRGVTTVVAKLFNAVLPDIAVFGAKDWQQAAVIRRMTADLNFPLRIEVAPTHREPDGLAMSSRNVYLNPEQRAQAVVLSRALRECRRRVARRRIPATELRNQVMAMVSACSAARLDYVEFFDPDTLEPVARVGKGSRMALAVFFGHTRLIDNGGL